ncbi:MAG TPA: carbohydrate ABC transporter permease [Clostridiaceae bacterium]|nr:carbohydrate ABC transporter permease [Clostridiaceae bacterium]
MIKKREDRVKGAWRYIILLSIFSLIIVIPYAWLVARAFTTNTGEFTLSNWSFMWKETPYFRGLVLPVVWKSFGMSLLFASGTAILMLSLTIPTAYAISRTKFPGRPLLTKLMIILDAFPTVALLIGFFYVLNAFGLMNSYFGVILIKVGMSLPGTIWLMKSFFDNVPWELEWAAIVDGASRFKTFTKIIIPVVKPGAAVILINSFLSGWGEYILLNLFIIGKSTTMSTFIGMTLTNEGKIAVPFGILAAASLLYVIPVVILFSISQKTLLSVQQGGIKN